jgi:hypothetical protein
MFIYMFIYLSMCVLMFPSVCVRRFTDVDFQSIQRIGDSLKKEDSKGTKTGRFGGSLI